MSPVSPAAEVDLGALPAFRVEHFPRVPGGSWLDRPDYADRIEDQVRAGTLNAKDAELCRQWAEDGYIIIRGMFRPEQLDAAWASYEAAIESGTFGNQKQRDPLSGAYTARILNPHLHIEAFKGVLNDPQAVRVVGMLLGADALPFQTIAGHLGSQQKAHSDSIHMTTYPEGFLAANWIAFEDIHPDSGPLEFYPGSHRLPYIYSRDCGIGLDEGRAGYDAYQAKYEPAVQQALRDSGLKPEYFTCRKGDVLFWHANLLHGGSLIRNGTLTRKALVCHYFAQGCVCYHDYTGSPTYLTKLPPPKTPLVSREEFDAEAYLRLNADVAAAGVDAYKHYVEYGHAEGRRLK
jgi:hypothetical protein